MPPRSRSAIALRYGDQDVACPEQIGRRQLASKALGTRAGLALFDNLFVCVLRDRPLRRDRPRAPRRRALSRNGGAGMARLRGAEDRRRPISEGRAVHGARRGIAQNIRRQPRGGQAAFGGGGQSSGRSGILVDEKGRGSGSSLDRGATPLLVESQLSTVPLGATLRIA